MRAVAAFPAVALLAGSALGLLAPDIPFSPGAFLLVLATAAAICAWCLRSLEALATSVVLVFFIGGALLAADAWRQAWRPSLRVVFEELARAERAQAVAEHRPLPEDDETFAIVEGVLRTDGELTASGASLGIAVDSVKGVVHFFGDRSGEKGIRPVFGGVLATVVGSLDVFASRFSFGAHPAISTPASPTTNVRSRGAEPSSSAR